MKQLATVRDFPATLVTAVKGRTKTTGLSRDGELAYSNTWKLPVITEEIQAQASIALAQMEDTPDATDADKAKWVGSLMTLCTGRKEVGDVKAKIVGYSAMIEYPEFVFTKSSLARAATKFTWFPAYAELVEFLDSEVSEYRTIIRRLTSIVDADIKSQDSNIQEPVAERRDHASKVMANLRKAMGRAENADK